MKSTEGQANLMLCRNAHAEKQPHSVNTRVGGGERQGGGTKGGSSGKMAQCIKAVEMSQPLRPT